MNEFYIIEKIISELKKEVNLYEDLFGNSESVAILNNSFSDAFSIFQKAMFFEIVCRISALFDPVKTRSDKNLTLAYLVEICGDKITTSLAHEVDSVKYDFQQTGIKEVRNKAYAHYDLKKYLGTKQLTTNISYEIISNLLDNIFSVVRKLGLHTGMVLADQTIVRSTKLPKDKDGASLLSRLSNS